MGIKMRFLSQEEIIRCGGLEIGLAINDMEEEHDAAGNLFKEIEHVTNDFTAPEDACRTYKRTFDLLGALQKDTFNHIHLENSVLFLKLDD